MLYLLTNVKNQRKNYYWNSLNFVNPDNISIREYVCVVVLEKMWDSSWLVVRVPMFFKVDLTCSNHCHWHISETAIESTSQLVPFPLLTNGNYTACTIPWRFPSDDPSIPTPTELSWINLLLNTIPTFKYVIFFFFPTQKIKIKWGVVQISSFITYLYLFFFKKKKITEQNGVWIKFLFP